MKTFLLISIALFFSLGGLYGQHNGNPAAKSGKKHKIVFQMVSKDTADHNALVRQLFNLLKLAPLTKVEVVCHGPGINFILKEKSLVADKIKELATIFKIDFVACEFTMQQKNIKREQLMEECRTVPGGILEIVDKQASGWQYIKAGY